MLENKFPSKLITAANNMCGSLFKSFKGLLKVEGSILGSSVNHCAAQFSPGGPPFLVTSPSLVCFLFIV